MNSLFYVYAFSAMIEMVVLEYVIRQVDFDRINNLDPEWVRWARKTTFFAGQAYLFLTVMLQIWNVWEASIVDIGLIWAGILILSVNVISLHLRTPRPGSGYFAVWQRATRWGRMVRVGRRRETGR